MDNFAHENLPTPELLPRFLPAPHDYPAKLNAASYLFSEAEQRGWSNQPLLLFKDETWTYQQCDALSNQFARLLQEQHHLEVGERVLLRSPNTAALAIAWLGVIKAGGICVTTMPLLRSRELAYITEKVQIRHCVCDNRFADEVDSLRTTGLLPETYYFPGENTNELASALGHFSPEPLDISTAADAISIIAFTSGTTGQAKATAHTHRDLLIICDCFPSSILKAQASDIFTGTPPLGFTFGLGGLLLFPMRVGAATLLIEKPSPEELLRQIQQQEVTVLFTSPTAYRGLLEHLSPEAKLPLRRCVSAGETLPRATFDAWEKAAGIKIIDGIGATEMLHIFISAADDEIRPGSTGKAIPFYEAKVVDENGNECPRGEIGLLAVRGPTGCRYLADPDRQTGYVRWGWNITGDAYIQDNDGYFWFQARADDMIISAGYNISGIEVENAVLRHPAVKECAVVGTADSERGQIVKAFIVLKQPNGTADTLAKNIQDFVKAEIAPYKYPRSIEFVTELPRTETGKLQRFKLRN